MEKILPTVPISDLRKAQAQVLHLLKETPVVLTSHGDVAGVFVNIEMWNQTADELRLLRGRPQDTNALSVSVNGQVAAPRFTRSEARPDQDMCFSATHTDPESARDVADVLLQQVWETSVDAMVLSDAKGMVLAANPAYLRLYGYTAEQLIGQSFALIFPADKRAWAVEEYQAVFARQVAPVAFESMIQRADGTERIVESQATFLTTAGQRTAMLSTIRDITERKQAEARLQVIYHLSDAVNRVEAIEQIYEVALDALIQVLHVDRASILLFDADAVLRFKAWRNLSAVYRQQVEGHTPWTIHEPQPPPILIPDVTQAALGTVQAAILAEGIQAVAFIPLIEQGQLLGKFMLYYNQPHPFLEAEVQWAQTIAQHVAHALQRKQAEVRLRQFNANLEASVASRTADLQRNEAQLRALASRLTLAEQEERRRIAQILHDDLQQRLYALQMQTMFIIEGAESSVQPHLAADAQLVYTALGDAISVTRHLSVDLSPPILKGEGLVDTLRWLLVQMAEVHGLHVTLRAEHAFRIRDADMRVLLFQIVRELLFNICKHAATDQATVELRSNKSGQLLMQISDAGRGFDVAAATAAHAGGFGLFSVRERLHLFGGHMTIDSARGHGTRITLTVPVVSPQGATAPLAEA